MVTKKERGTILTAGLGFIDGGKYLAIICLIVGVVMLLAGGPAPLAFAGVIPSLLLMAVGYLKKIATTLEVTALAAAESAAKDKLSA